MSGNPGYTKKVNFGGSAVPFTTAQLSHGGDVLDDTDMSVDSAAADYGWRSRVLGLRDSQITGSGNWDPSNTVLQAIRTAWLNRTATTVQYLPDGTVPNGFQADYYVQDLNLSGDVGGLETFSVTLVANTALVAAV